MINAVTNTSAASPVGAAARPAGHESAVRVAAPAPHAAPAPAVAVASHESTVVTISAQAARSAQLAQAAHVAHQATAQGKAAAAPAAQPSGVAPQAAAGHEHAAQAPAPGPALHIHATYISPAPAPLSLDPIPSQHLPAIAFSPADVNKDGHVSASESESYSFHHAPSLAAQPGEAEADLSAYTSIARG